MIFLHGNIDEYKIHFMVYNTPWSVFYVHLCRNSKTKFESICITHHHSGIEI